MAADLSPYTSLSAAYNSASKTGNLPWTTLLASRRSPRHLKPIRRCHHQIRASNVQPLHAVLTETGLAESDALTKHAERRVQERRIVNLPKRDMEKSTLSIVVVGATGSVAREKIFPALFALFYDDQLPKNFTIFGYARSSMSDEELRNLICRTLTCRIDKRESCIEKMEHFLRRCFHHCGQYSSEEHFSDLHNKLNEQEAGRVSNRLFYMAIPPEIIVDVARCAKKRAASEQGWTRFIVEKPFCRDLKSSQKFFSGLKQYLTEDQIFRIDHELGEELVENLMVLRFSNLVFGPLWSRDYVHSVQVIFYEDCGAEGQGRYFDKHGIIRDIMQNHMLHVLALFAMEPPVSFDADDIRNEKVKVLRSMKPVLLKDVVLGRYKGRSDGRSSTPAYTDDPHVQNDSLTPTFAAATLFIDNGRWDGVPFMMVAGKALQSKRVEIRVQFRHVPGNLCKNKLGNKYSSTTNEFVIRAEPDEAMFFTINNKVPGLGMRLDSSDLHLLYKSMHPRKKTNPYQRLLLDAVQGERRLFARSDELEAAWSVFSPLLEELEDKKVAPELYHYGGTGPIGTHYLAAKHNIRFEDASYES